MLFTDTVGSLGSALISVGQSVLAIIPTLFVAVVVLVVGIFIANVLGRLVTELATSLKIDALFSRTGLRDAFKRGNISFNAAHFIGQFVRWIVVLAFLVTTLEIVGLTQVTSFLTDILAYVPELIAAGLIIVVTAVIAEFLKKLVAGSTRAAALGGAELAGSVVKGTAWIFGIIVALQELGLPTSLFQIVITGAVAGLSLAFGLAFGLGGREVAAKMLERKYEDMHK